MTTHKFSGIPIRCDPKFPRNVIGFEQNGVVVAVIRLDDQVGSGTPATKEHAPSTPQER